MTEPLRRVDGEITDDEKIRILEAHHRACWACIQAGAQHHCKHIAERSQDMKPLLPSIVSLTSTVVALNEAGMAGGENSVSPIETRLLEAFWRSGLDPVQQYQIGPYTVDFAFPRARLVVEADGAEYHQDAEKERARDEAIRRRGWHIVHFDGSVIHSDPDGCVMQIYRLARSSLI